MNLILTLVGLVPLAGPGRQPSYEAPSTSPTEAPGTCEVLPSTDSGSERRELAAQRLTEAIATALRQPAQEAWQTLQVARRESALALEEGSILKRLLLETPTSPAGTDGVVDFERAMSGLRRQLESLALDLAFVPRIEAPMAAGFPMPTPVGEIAVLDYPAYRVARASMKGAARNGGGAFWKLFNHIQSKQISMTTPVETSYDTSQGTPRAQWMGFLYESTAQGTAGEQGAVEVVDLPATRVLSIGRRGTMSEATMSSARAELEAWLVVNPGWIIDGPWRSMGWNSPMVPDSKRYWELQVQVRRLPVNG